MNEKMLLHPATQKNIRTLESWNIKILETNEGFQACRNKGKGRLMEPEEIYKNILGALEI